MPTPKNYFGCGRTANPSKSCVQPICQIGLHREGGADIRSIVVQMNPACSKKDCGMFQLTYLTPPQPCPGCGAPNNAHYDTTAPSVGPAPGAVSVCAYCITVGVFAEEGGVRLPTKQEAIEFATDVNVQEAVRFARGNRLRAAWAAN